MGSGERDSDLCCYWFEQGRRAIEAGRAKRVGLLATQAIRGGANRRVLRSSSLWPPPSSIIGRAGATRRSRRQRVGPLLVLA